MLVVFPPIYVADKKIIYGYNFVAPLRFWMSIFVILFVGWTKSFVGYLYVLLKAHSQVWDNFWELKVL